MSPGDAAVAVLRAGTPELGALHEVAQAAHEASGRLDAALSLARDLGATTYLPGRGSTARRWEVLATLGLVDLEVARIVEPHLDALAILSELPQHVDLSVVGADESSIWGVFAAEGADVRLTAAHHGDGWTLSGTKPWCSLAAHLTHALVTAWVDDKTRGLFAVNLRDPRVDTGDTGNTTPWVAHGLSSVVSTPIRLDRCPVAPIATDQWYLERPGFWWGGMGVAACWWGGALGLHDFLVRHLRARPAADLTDAAMGEAEVLIDQGRSLLAAAAGQVDTGRAGVRTALIVRSGVRRVCEQIQSVADHALGPGPLVSDVAYARRVADLHLYVRQEPGSRSLATIGRLVLDATEGDA